MSISSIISKTQKAYFIALTQYINTTYPSHMYLFNIAGKQHIFVHNILHTYYKAFVSNWRNKHSWDNKTIKIPVVIKESLLYL